MRGRSLSSVAIKSANRERITRAVRDYVAQLRAEHVQVERVIWFGSWVNGILTPGSDVDLCLIVSSSEPRPGDRAAAYLPVGFLVGVDLFVYTPAEFEQLRQVSPTWYAAIVAGREVMGEQYK